MHKIVVWGKQAEIAQQYLKKGSLIFIEGRIQSREWQDKEGQKRTSFEIVATNFRMLGGPRRWRCGWRRWRFTGALRRRRPGKPRRARRRFLRRQRRRSRPRRSRISDEDIPF